MEMKRLNGQGMKAAGYDERNRKLVAGRKREARPRR